MSMRGKKAKDARHEGRIGSFVFSDTVGTDTSVMLDEIIENIQICR